MAISYKVFSKIFVLMYNACCAMVDPMRGHFRMTSDVLLWLGILSKSEIGSHMECTASITDLILLDIATLPNASSST